MKTFIEIKKEVIKSMATDNTTNLVYWTTALSNWAAADSSIVSYTMNYIDEPTKPKEDNKLCLCTKHLWS
jgi:hypothetical protein